MVGPSVEGSFPFEAWYGSEELVICVNFRAEFGMVCKDEVMEVEMAVEVGRQDLLQKLEYGCCETHRTVDVGVPRIFMEFG